MRRDRGIAQDIGGWPVHVRVTPDKGAVLLQGVAF
jgi:hypothetical protein